MASIVLVSIGGVQSKAKITKGLEFSQTVQHVLGAYAVGIWSFDEGSGTVARDSAGYGNDGAINGASYTDDTPHKAAGREAGKYALNFDGNDYVNAGNDSSLNITGAITIEAWVKYGTMSGSRDIVTHSGCGGYFLYAINGDSVAIGQQCNGNVLSAGVRLDDSKWHHVVGTYDGTMAKIYVDNVLKNKGAKSWTFSNAGNLAIGRNGDTSSEYFIGLIDEVKIYERALTTAEIQKHYADGSKTHKNLTVR